MDLIGDTDVYYLLFPESKTIETLYTASHINQFHNETIHLSSLLESKIQFTELLKLADTNDFKVKKTSFLVYGYRMEQRLKI